jgi:S-adenosylmethionine synthetase
MADFLFTSESVSMGHPDKVADQISDGVLDAHLQQFPLCRVACETLCTTNLVVLSGEITTSPDLKPIADAIDYVKLARQIVSDIGYNKQAIPDEVGFSAEEVRVMVALHAQSGDIAMGVDRDGAGDQGLMFGHACNQTPELMPLPIALSHKILNVLTDRRQKNHVDWLRPDAKSQVTVEYRDGKPVSIPAVVVSTQHHEKVSQKDIHDYVVSEVIRKTVPAELLTKDTKYHINPTGRFVTGGPHGDTGLTGRKIIVDTYGGWGRHGGGAFSGKDPTKVDRSAAYMARHVAKNIVAAGLATECEVQLAYAIGVADPVSIRVDTFGTGKAPEAKIVAAVRELFPLTPRGIIQYLELRRPIYRKTAAGGHFGRSEPEFTWEATHRADDLKKAAG